MTKGAIKAGVVVLRDCDQIIPIAIIAVRMLSQFHNCSLPADVPGLDAKGNGIIFQSLLESNMIPHGEYLIWLEIDPAAPGQKLF